MMEQIPNGWRFLNTHFENAFFNMAVDQAVVKAVEQGYAPPTFRVFGWAPPAVSLGYAQKASQGINLNKCKELGIDVVRRLTGGRTVLHWNELTYSVLCLGKDPILGGTIREAYQKINACLVEGVKRLGIDVNFESRRSSFPSTQNFCLTSPCFSSIAKYEVTFQGRKLIGSAQRRIGRMLLQHGSLLMGPEHKKLVELLPIGQEIIHSDLRKKLDRQTISLEEALGTSVPYGKVVEALRSGFRDFLQVPLIDAPLTPDEFAEANLLAREKYNTDSWNLKDRH